MRKKVLSVFLALVMTLCLAPTVAFANGETGDNTDKTITLGTSGISAYDKNTGKADTIYYGVYTKDGKNYNVPWYVINFDTENNTGFMLSKYTLGNSEFRNNVRGYYAGSKLQTVMNGLYNGENTSLFTGMEQGAINATTLIGSSMYSTESDIKNAHLFPLSIDEAESLGWKSDILKAKDITNPDGKACWWWLRSSDPHYAAAYVASSGDYWYDVMSTCDAVRPAFNLNLNSVLLTSASGTSKSSAIVSDSAQIGAMTGNEWKLTLKDTRKTINLADNQAVSMAADGTITVPYTYTDTATADTEKVNQISVMITKKSYTESNAEILYYGALQGTLSANGTGTFVLPSTLQGQALGTDYHVYILAEHTTNTNATDYSSTPAEITNVSITGAAITGIDTPTATQALDTSASCATAGVTTSTPTVTWNPTATTAGYNTSYTASVTLSPSTGYTFADSVAATVNENAATSVTKNQNGTLTVTYAFAATAKDKLTSITMPSQINVANGTEYDTIVAGLPSQVNIVTEGKTVTTASVTWNTQTPAGGSYNPSKLEEQNITLNGTVTCPDTVDSNNVPLTTMIAIKIQHGHGFDGAEWKYDTTNHWHECTVANCDKSAGYITDSGEHTDTAVKDHKCDTCGKVLSTCADNDDDHLCDVCGAKLSDHTGGEANCTSGEICKICKNEYGTKNPRNHTDLNHFDRNEATVNKEGNIEYWYCDGCKKYFSDENAENEINSADTVIAKLAPSIISGDGQTVTEGDKKALEFTSDAAFGDFIRVEVDGKTIAESNYTVKSGSIVVTLNANYVSTLSAGEHTLGIVSQSGTATTKFTVNKKVEETTTPTTTDNTKSPQTGDNSNIFLWLALLFVSGGAVTATTIASKKRKYNR
jgi:maltodextrin utilization protein YvdJ